MKAFGTAMVFDLASSTHSDKSCRVLANDIGGVTVVYQDYWSNPIYGQNYDSSGSKTWGEAGLALVDSDDMVEMKNVLSYPGGGFLVHINIIAETSYKVLRFSVRVCLSTMTLCRHSTSLKGDWLTSSAGKWRVFALQGRCRYSQNQ